MIWSKIYKELSGRIMSMRELLDGLPDLSPELAEELVNVPDVCYIDLWHEQVSHLEEEHPFPTPAVFIEFNTLQTDDVGINTQDITTQIDLHVFWETFADTYTNAVMQEEALDYLNLLTVINLLMHGYSGADFSTMRKTGFHREESGGAGNLYRATFECVVRDYTAMELKLDVDMNNKDINVSDEEIPDRRDNDPLYMIS